MKKIVSIWEEVQTQILDKDISREALLSDSFLQWAMTTPLYNIGEQVYSDISNSADTVCRIELVTYGGADPFEEQVLKTTKKMAV